jgi:uncharacterized membrane protein
MMSPPTAQSDSSRLWSSATWAAPFTTQLVLGAMLIAQWVLGKLSLFPEHDRAWFLTGLAISTVMMVLFGGALLTRPSPRLRGLALSMVGLSVIVLVGGVVLSVSVLRW